MITVANPPVLTCVNLLNSAEVLAALMWPRDDERRRHYLAAVVAQLLNLVDRVHELCICIPGNEAPGHMDVQDWLSSFRAVTFERCLHERWTEVGGLEAVSRAALDCTLSNRTAHRFKGWCTVGYMMDLIHRMAVHHPSLPGGAGVNKAAHVVEELGQGNELFYHQRRRILEAWTEYRPVGHLCAAYFVTCAAAACQGDAAPNDRAWEAIDVALFRSGPGPFLGLAGNYLRFGLNYQTPRSRGPLLNPDETRIAVWPTLETDLAKPTGEPIQIKKASQFDLAAGSLSPVELAVAREYRAFPRY